MLGTIGYLVILWLIAWQYIADKRWFAERFRNIDDPKTLLPEFRIIPFIVLFSAGSLVFVKYFAYTLLPEATYHWIADLSFFESDTLEIAIITSLVLAPIVEEIGFRGFFFDYLTSRKGIVIGIFVNAVIFGLLHKFSFVHASVVGIILSIIYFRTSNVFASIIVHAFINLGALTFHFLLVTMEHLFPDLSIIETFDQNLIIAFIFLAISFGPLFSYFKNNLRPIINEYGYGLPADNDTKIQDVDEVSEAKPQESIDTV